MKEVSCLILITLGVGLFAHSSSTLCSQPVGGSIEESVSRAEFVAETYDKRRPYLELAGGSTYSRAATDAAAFSTPPTGLVAGCWRGRIFGLTLADASVQFQYRQGAGPWIPIGVAQEDVYSSDSLIIPGEQSGVYSVYWSQWLPADGAYQIRMLASYEGHFDENLSPILNVTVSGGKCIYSETPHDFGPGSIESNPEYPCDSLKGTVCVSSAYGFPYGVFVVYNVPSGTWNTSIVKFRALQQQPVLVDYVGEFTFADMVAGAYGQGHALILDYTGMISFTVTTDYETYRITHELGSGGPIAYVDGSVIVDIPAEWIEYPSNTLAIWKSRLARPSIWQNWLLMPLGDNNRMMTYLSDPSCDNLCSDVEQYAIVTMQYNANNATPFESLMVAWWDGESEWRFNNVYFPSTVRGFYREGGQNWVQFAITCFGDGYYGDIWYSVVKRTWPFGNYDCGDVDGSGAVGVGDVVYLINWLFADGPMPLDSSRGDFNCDGRVNITDAVYLINYIFTGGPPPCANCP